MGPNGVAISEKYFFDPRRTAGNDLEVEVGSRVSRQMISKKKIREALDMFSGAT